MTYLLGKEGQSEEPAIEASGAEGTFGQGVAYQIPLQANLRSKISLLPHSYEDMKCLLVVTKIVRVCL